MAKKEAQPPAFELPPQMAAPAPTIATVAISGPPSEVEELRAQLRLRDEEIARRDEEIARLRATLDAHSRELERLAPATPELGVGAGSPVSLVEYRDGRIYETTATVVAQLADRRLRVRARGSHEVIEVAPHDGSKAPTENRIGWHGYQYEDPLHGTGLQGVS